MKLIKATALARALGISRFTIRDWCRRDPKLVVKKGRDNWIRLDELAKRPDIDIVTLLMALNSEQKWIPATTLARLSGVPRRTVAYWCATRPCFAHRIGRNWYVSIDALGATPEQAEILSELSSKEEHV